MHPPVSLHQVAFMAEPTARFIEFCRGTGVGHCTLVTPKLELPDELSAARGALADTGVKAGCINHPFALHPNLERDSGGAASGLMRAIDIAADLGASSIYLITGGRGSLSWEEAAARFAELIAPCRDAAQGKGIALLVENASALNVDIHMAHTLPDAVSLAHTAGIGVCVDLHACWMEAALKDNLARAMPLTGLVQVSDYVLGDRSTPCRAVPGDGVIPLERILGDMLDLGYTGLFDLELVGPRIEQEGPASACSRAVEYLSELLERLGA